MKAGNLYGGQVVSEMVNLVKETDQIWTLLIDHPPANTLDSSTMEALNRALEEVESQNRLKAVLIRSASPKFFSAGAEIREFAGIRDATAAREYAEKGQMLMNRIAEARQVFIAVIEGICAGGGCELAMACHLRIAGAEAKLGQPEINLGLIPGFGGTQRLARLVGYSRGLELLLAGKLVSAEEAFRLGLINQLAEKGQAYGVALELAKWIESKGKAALEAMLCAVREGLNGSLEDGLAREAKLFANLFETRDMREGIEAFLEKRPPRFEDR